MCFSRNDEDIGSIKSELGDHDIKITNDTYPIRQRPYKLPFAKEQVVEECVAKMLKMGIIEETNDEWASPIVLFKKADGSERFCVDFRKVNAIAIKASFPSTSVESKLNKLNGCKLFTLLDCTSGYWQIELSERAKLISSFICHWGLFSFNVMPFGLCNAVATFQRTMETLLKGVESSTAYIDDVLTHSKRFQEDMKHLRRLLEKLKESE